MRHTALIAIVAAGAAAACNLNELGNLRAAQTGSLVAGDSPRGPFDAHLQQCGDDAPASAPVLRAPYLQQVTDDGAMVLWTTDAGSSAELIVSEPGGATVATIPADVDRTATLQQGTQYRAAISDLEPFSVYCYEVRIDDQRVYGPTGFRTAPEPGSTQRVSFATLGDLGSQTGDQLAVLEQLQTLPMDFVLINGDVAYENGTMAEVEDNFFSVYADMLDNVPFFVGTGNHDYGTDDAAPLLGALASFENGGPAGLERWYSFDWGPLHMVVLDTERSGAEQAEWLDRDLAATTQPWTIVTGHRPAYSSGVHGNDPAVQQWFLPIFEKHQVPLVLAGHDHNYERTNALNGVTYVVAGAGGRGTRTVGTSSFTAHAQSVSHAVYIEADDRNLTMWAVDATGQVFDSQILTR